MGAELRSLAHNEALQYMLQEYGGSPTPIITAAFWCDGKGERVAAAEPWSGVFDHGAFLIRNQLMERQAALDAWQAEYELGPTEIGLIESLSDRKAGDPTFQIDLDDEQQQLLRSLADEEEGVDASRESFSEIGIIFP